MLDSLKISDANATAIIALGIEFDVFDGDIPESPKDRMEESHKLVSFAIEGMQSEIEDEDVKGQIETILSAAGVEVEGDGEIINFGKAPKQEALEEILEEQGLEVEFEDEETEGDDDEAAFDVDDIIEDWSSLSLKDAKVALGEWSEGDDIEFEEVETLLEYEEEQDKPRKSIVARLEEIRDEFEGDDDEGTEETEEDAEGESEDGEEDSGEEEAGEYDEEPYEGYDTDKVGDLKEVIDDEERTAEELEYILGYEESHKDRSTIVKRIKDRIEELGEEPEADEEPDEEEVEEEKPAKAKRGRKAKAKKPADEYEEIDESELEDNLPPHFAALISEENSEAQAKSLGLKPAEDDYDEDELPALPDDIATEDRDTLSNLMGIYTAAHATASWYTSLEYVLSVGYGEVGDYYENASFVEAEGSEAARKAEAKTDGRVVYFRSQEKAHYGQYVMLRDAKESLKRRIETISRVGGFKVEGEEIPESIAAKPKSGTAKRTSRTRRK